MNNIEGLAIVQQPIRCCVAEPGEKQRRPIDPPPILKIITKVPDDANYIEFINSNAVIVHVNLISIDTEENIDYITNPEVLGSSSAFNSFWKDHGRILTGGLTSSAHLVKGISNEKECYFVFPDLYIASEGTFRLKFSLIIIPSNSEQHSSSFHIQHQVCSESFVVYSPNNFPGVDESTELSKSLALQGVGIPIRNKSRLRR
ncbi:hypothetical protein BB561_004966 [Smittium simulii]|uniref:Velvet domain-containing protein n=1 Tax=Smittium simulii TaxID=133385 RepID=A0A2T9YD64_9FUNG|nr:hypothetical protein BB561_004966 [Smittium simulii]